MDYISLEVSDKADGLIAFFVFDKGKTSGGPYDNDYTGDVDVCSYIAAANDTANNDGGDD